MNSHPVPLRIHPIAHRELRVGWPLLLSRRGLERCDRSPRLVTVPHSPSDKVTLSLCHLPAVISSSVQSSQCCKLFPVTLLTPPLPSRILIFGVLCCVKTSLSGSGCPLPLAHWGFMRSQQRSSARARRNQEGGHRWVRTASERELSRCGHAQRGVLTARKGTRGCAWSISDDLLCVWKACCWDGFELDLKGDT